MFRYVSLGCKVNQAEVSEMKAKIEQAGHDCRLANQAPDIVVINTCAVTGVAEAKSRKIIRRMMKECPDARLIVTGCFAELQASNIRKWLRPDDVVVGNLDKSRIPDLIGEWFEKEGRGNPRAGPFAVDLPDGRQALRPGRSAGLINRAGASPAPTNFDNELSNDEDESRTRAFVKIQDGCDAFCSYCIVPFLRGKLWTRPLKTTLQEVAQLVERGYKEIVLSGVNLGRYQQLTELLREMVQFDQLARIRISSIELNDITDELIDLMAAHPKICPHWHIPLQSGSDRILRAMRRKYSAADFLKRMKDIKRRVDNPALTTDVIVGFPGETDADFQQTLAVCEETGFSKIHIFRFSARSGTPAAVLPDKVNIDIIKNRFQILNNLAQNLSLLYKQSFLNKTVAVLIEEDWAGYTDRYLRVKIESVNSKTAIVAKNHFVSVRINKVSPGLMQGKGFSPRLPR